MIHADREIEELIASERERQERTITLIPSENYASAAVQEAVGSALANKYSEGYAGKRYYEGNEIIDQVELLAIERAKKLFGVPYANVQPYSGSPANSEILFALAPPGSAIMGLALSSGGHLTHGHPNVTFSGRYYRPVQFGLTSEARIDYEDFERKALAERPSVIILGTTAYPFLIDWEKARRIADAAGAWLVADISHIGGLIVGGVHPSPVPYAHVIMTTTHKTLRGPRGAMILATDEGLRRDADLGKKLDSAVMPGMQGGPHNNTTSGIAVALHEASTEEFRAYGRQIVANAAALALALKEKGISLVGGGTENHLMVMDFSSDSQGKGALISFALNAAGIVTNRNTVPHDASPFYPSGVRIGTPAATTRGMKEEQMSRIAEWIADVVDSIDNEKLPDEKAARAGYLNEFRTRVSRKKELAEIREAVARLCAQFPIPSGSARE
jgi:glycine hydroxymethyltransferase